MHTFAHTKHQCSRALVTFAMFNDSSWTVLSDLFLFHHFHSNVYTLPAWRFCRHRHHHHHCLCIYVLFSHSITIKFSVQITVYFCKSKHKHTIHLAQNEGEGQRMNVTNYHKFIVKETATHWNFHIDLDIKLTTNKIDYFIVAEQRSCLLVRTRVRTVWLGLIFYSIAFNYHVLSRYTKSMSSW